MSSVSDDRTFTEWEHRMVVNVGRKVGYQWNIECDDVISELMLWAHESWKYVTRYRSDKRGKQKLMASLYRKANKYARAEHQAKMIHYQFDKEQTENVYTDRQVETGLVVMFMPSDTKSEYDEDMWSLVADVSGVYASLRSEDKSLLAWKKRATLRTSLRTCLSQRQSVSRLGLPHRSACGSILSGNARAGTAALIWAPVGMHPSLQQAQEL